MNPLRHLLQQLHQGLGRKEAAGLVLLDHRHRDGDGQVGLTDTTGAKQQQVSQRSTQLVSWASCSIWWRSRSGIAAQS